jgi:hypothetical protein
MKWLSRILSIAIIFSILSVVGTPYTIDAKSVRVKGYFRKDGTYVQPHYRSAPDGIKSNNWSYCGNVNPYTGEVGTVDCNSTSSSSWSDSGNTTSTSNDTYTGDSSSSSDSSESTTTNKETEKTTTTKIKGAFAIGSSKVDVIKVMGEPDDKSSVSFSYGYSLVFFDSKGKVSGWSNIGEKKLKASLGEKKDGAKPFTLGSTLQQVVDAMGTPDSASQSSFSYGYSLVFFGQDSKVSGWSNIGDVKLKATLGAKKPDSKGFNVGSTLQEVIDAMGTPDSVSSHSLGYEYSLVFFRNEKVTSYSDISNNLKIKTK